MQKKGLCFYLRIYFKILSQDLKSKMSFRADFFISLLGMIFTNLVGFVSFWIIFQNFSTINGWGYYEMLFLYAFSLISLTPVQCLFDNNWNLRGYVYSGDFVKYYFRPINLFFYYQSEIFDIKGLGQLAFGLILLIHSWHKLQIAFSIIVLFKCVLYIATSSLIMISLQNAAAATCFWTHNSFYVLDLILKFKDYSKYPATIYSPVFRFVFTFIIPITFIAYYPSMVIIRPDNVPLLSYISPLIACIFFFISYKIWMYGARKYNGTGS